MPLGANILQADTVYRRNANNLELTISGTTDKLIVKDWYLGSQYQVEQFRYADGTVVTSSQVAGLLSAMASFTAGAANDGADSTMRTTMWREPGYLMATV